MDAFQIAAQPIPQGLTWRQKALIWVTAPIWVPLCLVWGIILVTSAVACIMVVFAVSALGDAGGLVWEAMS